MAGAAGALTPCEAGALLHACPPAAKQPCSPCLGAAGAYHGPGRPAAGAEDGAEAGEEQEGDEDEGPRGASGAAAQRLLRDVRRLGEETLRISRPEAREALRAHVPAEDLLRLLRLLQRLVAAGTGQKLELGGHGGWGPPAVGRAGRGGL